MSLSMYDASVPVFLQMLNNLSTILDKAEADARNRKIAPEVLLNYRLAPDMFPFVRQIQIATDLAKGAAARLAGVEVPKHDDTEKTCTDLKARIDKTVMFVQSIQPSDIEGSESRDITLTLGEHTLSFKGQPQGLASCPCAQLFKQLDNPVQLAVYLAKLLSRVLLGVQLRCFKIVGVDWLVII